MIPEAVMKLTALGYRFEAAESRLRWRYDGPGPLDPGQVRPLLQLVKEHKEEVLFFLRCCCPRCGGIVFMPDLEGQDLCAACDWHLLTELYPGLREVSEHKKTPVFITKDRLNQEDIRPRDGKQVSADKRKGRKNGLV